MIKQRILDEARKLAVDVLYSEKGHFVAASTWSIVGYCMGIPSAVLAGVAATTIFKGHTGWMPGTLTAVSAGLTAISTILNPADRAARHHRTGVAYGLLRRRLRCFVHIDSELLDDSNLVANLQQFILEIGKLQTESSPIPKFAFTRAKALIKVGTADYTDGELKTAVGEP